VVDERSAQQANRVIKDLISSAEKLAKTLSGVSLGGAPGAAGGNGLVTGSVGGSQSTQQMVSKVQGSQSKGLAQVFIDNGNALKGLANVSTSSMRIMSEGIARAVDQQKRSLSDLDTQLVKLAKRYDDLKDREKAAIANGLSPTRAREMYGAKGDELTGQMLSAQTEREKIQGNLAKLQEHERQMAIARDPAAGGSDDDGGGGGGGFADRYGRSGFGRRFPLRTADGRLFRGGVVGGAIFGGRSWSE
jgi:hypothetical protein